MAVTMMPQVGFYRNMGETASHIATGWTNDAFCGTPPAIKGIGWMFGANNTVFSGITEICPECQDAYREIAEACAAR